MKNTRLRMWVMILLLSFGWLLVAGNNSLMISNKEGIDTSILSFGELGRLRESR